MRTVPRYAIVALATFVTLISSKSVTSQELSLTIDPFGQAFLTNHSVDAASFQAYQIASGDNVLAPTTWSSIADQNTSNPVHVRDTLGEGAYWFGEANPTKGSLAELNLSEVGTLAPGGEFGIGYPFSEPVGPDTHLKFFFMPPQAQGPTEGAIRFLNPELGGLLRLLVDDDGSAWLENSGSSPVSFDGYQITSENNDLNAAGWTSVADRVSDGNADQITALLGAGGLGFHETSASYGNLTELNRTGEAILQPGARLDLGNPFLGDVSGNASFYYRVLGAQTQQGAIVNTPEPSTWLLAALAGVGLLATRRRR